MVRALVYLVIILLGLCISPFLVGSKGYLYLAIGDYQVETSIVFAVIALIIFYSLLQLVEFVVVWLLNMILSSRYLPERWRKKAARKHTLLGALALAEEDWPAAEKAMAKGAEKGEIPALNLLAAARAAHHQDNHQVRDEYLAKAQLEPLAVKAVRTTRTRYLLQQGDLIAAREELDKLNPTSKSKQPVLKLAIELYQAQQDWQALKLLLPIVSKKHILADDAFQALSLKTNTALLTEASKANEQELEKCWHWLSRAERKQAEYIALYAIGLSRFERKAEAIKMLLKQVKTSAAPSIFKALAEVLTPADVEAKKQLLALETQFENNVDYQTCLAKLYQQNHDYHQAKIWWQKACYLQDDKDSLHALADAQEHLGELNRALQTRRNAAKLI
ncbi:MULTISPECIES: heme biosynthesis HemY N-terminal domain-containing protein [unclassified Shewanella]|uniref:heme biosynthesis HemY N-terminal domain-containing protein n=1 Tax=unclassified Shewanella TaxID=196818 RepID=UPI001BC22547|nr:MULTISPECIES: heme biosynthesis HemY N-terminal domain-containing protein [unclassified Shewanella]GIU20528.1 heme biosynthesis protein HemY [Shewanella sp. MBTL60-112-B1]GIU39887.1 heme biosynthesis protein HemY [Shewanella sp. MBTL60-112-B2]